MATLSEELGASPFQVLEGLLSGEIEILEIGDIEIVIKVQPRD